MEDESEVFVSFIEDTIDIKIKVMGKMRNMCEEVFGFAKFTDAPRIGIYRNGFTVFLPWEIKKGSDS